MRDRYVGTGELTSKVSVPLPSENEIRKVMGSAYNAKTTLNVIQMFAGTSDMYAATVALVNAMFEAKGISPKAREIDRSSGRRRC